MKTIITFLVVLTTVSTVTHCEPVGYLKLVCQHETTKLYTNDDYCTKYYACVNGEPKERDCAPGSVFNEVIQNCVEPGSEFDNCTPAHAERECTRNTTDLIPHPTKCQRYYNCSDKSPQFYHSPLGYYEKECWFPQQFDIRLKQCVDYQNAVCGKGRVMATWECQYDRNLCPVSMCQPCWSLYPSCIGREDGLWPRFDYSIWDFGFIECKSQRRINWDDQECPIHLLSGAQEMFNPVLRKCVTPWEVPRKHHGLEPSCKGKAAGIYTVKETPKVAYHCPGKELFWCDPPLSEDPGFKQCVPLGR